MSMNGAQSLVTTLVDCGVDVCFTNPGTSEMHFVAALDMEDRMRCVLGLFEGVVTGAADGYARMAGKPACTLLHLGPGLGNGLANLHNARRAFSPMVNVVGEHATYHRALDAPLTSDIEGIAAPVSGWVKVSERPQQVAADGAAAVQAAWGPPGRIATLILPADTAWEGPAEPAPALAIPSAPAVPDASVEQAISALRSGELCAFLISGNGTTQRGLNLIDQIARATGARVFADTFVPHIAGGVGVPAVARLPYFAEQAEEALAGVRHLILVDTKAPVSFFAYPGRASELTPEGAKVVQFSHIGDDSLPALEGLLDAVGTPEGTALQAERPRLAKGNLTPGAVAQSLAALLPEQAVLVNESATSGGALPGFLAASPQHDMLNLTGGAIGMGLPAALGAAVATPGRRTVALQADGSAMYTIQALWSIAREGLDVTTIIFANRKYAILQMEFMRVGAQNPGPKAMDMLDLSRPDLNFVDLAKGMGMPGMQARDAASFNAALAESFATPGPYLIEALV